MLEKRGLGSLGFSEEGLRVARRLAGSEGPESRERVLAKAAMLSQDYRFSNAEVLQAACRPIS